MDEETNYRLSARARQRKLEQFTNVSDPESLRAELGMARLLASEAADAGQTALAARLLETVAKCAVSHVNCQRMRGELLERATVVKIALALCELVAQHIQGRFIGWEDSLGAISEGIPVLVEQIAEPKLLTDERGKQ